jgi:hypothetical protein
MGHPPNPLVSTHSELAADISLFWLDFSYLELSNHGHH